MGVADAASERDVAEERPLAEDCPQLRIRADSQFVTRGGKRDDAPLLIGDDTFQQRHSILMLSGGFRQDVPLHGGTGHYTLTSEIPQVPIQAPRRG